MVRRQLYAFPFWHKPSPQCRQLRLSWVISCYLSRGAWIPLIITYGEVHVGLNHIVSRTSPHRNRKTSIWRFHAFDTYSFNICSVFPAGRLSINPNPDHLYLDSEMSRLTVYARLSCSDADTNASPKSGQHGFSYIISVELPRLTLTSIARRSQETLLPCFWDNHTRVRRASWWSRLMLGPHSVAYPTA